MQPDSFFTIGDLGTLAGLSAAVYVIVSVLRGAGLIPPPAQGASEWQSPTKVVALGIGLLLSVSVVLLSPQPTQSDIVMAIVNGCLAALAATGGSAAVQAGMVWYTGGVYRMAGSKPLWWERW